MATGFKGMLRKSVDDTKLEETVDSLRDRETFQRKLHKSKGWVIIICMKFNMGKCWILHLGCVQTGEQVADPRSDWDWGVVAESEPAVCLGSPKGQLYPGVHQPSTADQVGEGLSCSALC